MTDVKVAAAVNVLKNTADGTVQLISGKEAAAVVLAAYVDADAKARELTAKVKTLQAVNADLIQRLERANITIDALLTPAGDLIEKRGAAQ